MKIESVDRFFKYALRVSYVVAPIVILFFFWRACNRVEKQYLTKCKLEKTLEFNGVISNYKTDIFAEKSTFLLNDSIPITIPRNSKEMHLNDHDTVIKFKDSNLYIVKSSTLWIGQTRKDIDTFRFECPVSD